WMRNLAQGFTEGQFAWYLPLSTAGQMMLRVEAKGYLSAAREAKWDDALDFKLHSGPPTKGRVQNPDGTRAGDASIAVVFGGIATIENGELDTRAGNMSLCTGPDGAFAFPSQEPPFAIVAVNEQGAGIVMAEQFEQNPVVLLQPWGGLEVIT